MILVIKIIFFYHLFFKKYFIDITFFFFNNIENKQNYNFKLMMNISIPLLFHDD